MGWAEDVADLNETAVDLDGGFGAVFTFAPGGVPLSESFSGVFDENHVRVDLQLETGISTIGPTLWVLLSDLGAMPKRAVDQVIVNGKTYEILDAQNDGQNMLLLFLSNST